MPPGVVSNGSRDDIELIIHRHWRLIPKESRSASFISDSTESTVISKRWLSVEASFLATKATGSWDLLRVRRKHNAVIALIHWNSSLERWTFNSAVLQINYCFHCDCLYICIKKKRNKKEIIMLCQKAAAVQSELHSSSGLKILRKICMHLNIFLKW